MRNHKPAPSTPTSPVKDGQTVYVWRGNDDIKPSTVTAWGDARQNDRGKWFVNTSDLNRDALFSFGRCMELGRECFLTEKEAMEYKIKDLERDLSSDRDWWRKKEDRLVRLKQMVGRL